MPDPAPAVTPSTDVQASRPTTEVSLTRVGVRGVEKVIRVNGSLFFAELECFVDLNPQAGRRPHVALRGGRQRGDRRRRARGAPARRGAGRPHRRARPRAPGGPARGGHDRRPLPGDRPDPRLGPANAGDLHPVRHRRRVPARHPHPHRRRGTGDDRLPLRPGPSDRPRPRAPAGRRLHRRRDRAHLQPRPGRHPQPARDRLASHRPPRVLGPGDRRPRPAPHRRGRR